MFLLYWREDEAKGWTLEGQFTTEFRLIKYVANDVQGQTGIFKGVMQHHTGEVEFFSIDFTKIPR